MNADDHDSDEHSGTKTSERLDPGGGPGADDAGRGGFWARCGRGVRGALAGLAADVGAVRKLTSYRLQIHHRRQRMASLARAQDNLYRHLGEQTETMPEAQGLPQREAANTARETLALSEDAVEQARSQSKAARDKLGSEQAARTREIEELKNACGPLAKELAAAEAELKARRRKMTSVVRQIRRRDRAQPPKPEPTTGGDDTPTDADALRREQEGLEVSIHSSQDKYALLKKRHDNKATQAAEAQAEWRRVRRRLEQEAAAARREYEASRKQIKVAIDQLAVAHTQLGRAVFTQGLCDGEPILTNDLSELRKLRDEREVQDSEAREYAEECGLLKSHVVRLALTAAALLVAGGIVIAIVR